MYTDTENKEDTHTEIIRTLARLQDAVGRLMATERNAARAAVEATISKKKKKKDQEKPKTVYKMITKYTPLARPGEEAWVSKDVEFVQAFLDAFAAEPDKFKIRCRTNLADTELSVKLLVMKVTKQLSPPDLVAGRRTHYSLAITDLFARLVEFGDAIKKDDPTLSQARMELQKTHETPGWMARETRGSGIVLNKQAEQVLLPAAIERVRRLLVEQATTATEERTVAEDDEEGDAVSSADDQHTPPSALCVVE